VGDKLANADRLKAMKLQRAALAKKVDEYRMAVTQARKSASGSSQRLGQWAKGSKNPKPAALPVLEAPAGDARAAASDLYRREIVRLEFLKRSCELRAPFAGRVGEILLAVGGLSADPNVPVVTVVEEVSSRAIAYVAQTSATKIRVGDTVRLVPRDLSGPPLTGRVSALAPNITEMPVRFRRLPNIPEFGRNAYIELDAPANLPGQAFDAVFRHGPGSGT
jgi:multidrug resistance efflux pump